MKKKFKSSQEIIIAWEKKQESKFFMEEFFNKHTLEKTRQLLYTNFDNIYSPSIYCSTPSITIIDYPPLLKQPHEKNKV